MKNIATFFIITLYKYTSIKIKIECQNIISVCNFNQTQIDDNLIRDEKNQHLFHANEKIITLINKKMKSQITNFKNNEKLQIKR